MMIPHHESGTRDSLKREAVAFAIHLVIVSGFLWAMISLGLRNWDRFAFLLREDGAFETLTAGMLFLSCGMAHVLASTFKRAGRGRVAMLFWIGAVVFLIGGMEEISWGQRIFSFRTPDALAAINRQKEINFHNVAGFQGGTEVKVFLVLSVYGLLSGAALALALRWTPRTHKLFAFCDAARMFVVPARFSPYFLQMLVYVVMRRHDSRLLYVYPEKRLIKELLEFLFCLGCYLTLFYRLRKTTAAVQVPAPVSTPAQTALTT